MDKIKVLVADSSPIYALGLTQVLSQDKRIEVFNHVQDGQDVMDEVDKVEPDVVVIDIQFDEHGSVRVTEMLRESYPEVKVLILTPPEIADVVFGDAISAGAKGFLIKNINPTELVNGVIETANKGASIHPRMIPLLLEKLTERRKENPKIENLLSTRESEVIKLVAGGMCNRDIAETLFISENTVKGHLRRISNKLKVNNRVELARHALLNGLV